MPVLELKPESFHKYNALLKMTHIFLFNMFFRGYLFIGATCLAQGGNNIHFPIFVGLGNEWRLLSALFTADPILQ